MEYPLHIRMLVSLALLVSACGFCYSLGLRTGSIAGETKIDERLDRMNQRLIEQAQTQEAAGKPVGD